jgi:hypothetical protein
MKNATKGLVFLWLAIVAFQALCNGPVVSAKSTGKALLANLYGSIPHGVTFQSTLSRPDFLKMVHQHQAWTGFMPGSIRSNNRFRRKIDAENSSGVLQIIGLVVDAVVVIILSVISYGAFSGFAAGLVSSLGVSTAAGTAAAAPWRRRP